MDNYYFLFYNRSMEQNFEKEPTKKEKDPYTEELEDSYIEKQEEPEKKHLDNETEKIIKEKLEKEVEKMRLSPELEEEAKEKAEQIEALDEQGKVKRLLDLAQDKGVAFAIKTAKSMKDPYTLDILHDVLAKDELYKRLPR